MRSAPLRAVSDVDMVYEALMRAGHRPDAIDGYEITHTAYLFGDEDSTTSMAVRSAQAHERGEALVPAPPSAAAVARARARGEN